MRTGPVVAANTAGEGSPLLALAPNGALHGYDIATGKQTALAKMLQGRRRPARTPVIEVDTSRAYVNDAAARKVYEIDYNDNLRLARTFPLDFAPTPHGGDRPMSPGPANRAVRVSRHCSCTAARW